MNPSMITELLQGLDLPRLDIDFVEQIDDTAWCIHLADESAIDIEADPHGRPQLYLSTLLGSPDDDRRIEVYETTLILNSLAPYADGMSLAMHEESGELMALARHDLSDPGVAAFMETLTAFVQFSATWAAYVRAPAGSAASPDLHLNTHHGLRA